jgi:SAM-dependent methyltransferase
MTADILTRGRSCPACGGAEGRTVMRAEAPAEDLSFDDLSRSWRGFFRKSCFFSYRRCARCGQAFAPVYFSPATLDRLYAAMDDNIHSGDETTSEQTQESYADSVAQKAARAARYLEIGPDTGLFARVLQKRRRIEQAFLAEPNRKAWDALAAVFAPGVAKIVPSLDELETVVDDGSLDLAAGIHVLDHILEPKKTLDWVARKLAPGGVAAFVVHNERSLLARLLGRRWPAYCLQHPQLYNPETLAGLLRGSGFSQIKVYATVNYFPLGYLIAHGLYAVAGVKLSPRFLNWPVKLRLGNIMATGVKA